jgi:hypothetical protein
MIRENPGWGGKGTEGIQVRCTCRPTPLLGFLVRAPGNPWLKSTWWVQPVVDRRSVLSTLRREGTAAVDANKVSDGEAEVLEFTPHVPEISGKPAVDRQGALKARTGPFGPSPSPTAWLRKCPNCEQTPSVSRGRLYQLADTVEGRGEDTIRLTP